MQLRRQKAEEVSSYNMQARIPANPWVGKLECLQVFFSKSTFSSTDIYSKTTAELMKEIFLVHLDFYKNADLEMYSFKFELPINLIKKVKGSF